MSPNHSLRQLFIKLFCMIQFLILSTAGFSQEKKIDISIGEKSNWYEQPWAWVVGAAVFILLLVAILRSGKKN